jgi:hypothetical protein
MVVDAWVQQLQQVARLRFAHPPSGLQLDNFWIADHQLGVEGE